MAYWKTPKSRANPVINTFGNGVNTYLPPFDIQDGELTDSLNMCSDDYPSISVRPGRSTYVNGTTLSTSPKVNGMWSRNNQYISVLDGPDWRIFDTVSSAWSTLSTTVVSTNCKVVDFNLETENRSLLCASSEFWQYDGSAAARISTAPNSTNNTGTALITTHRQRAWMAFNKTAYYSAYNKSTDWNTVSDAGNIPIVNARGNITGLCTFDDHILIFTEHSMHTVYGTDPANYELVDISNEIGCISDRSIIEINGILYFCNYNGVYAFKGGTPYKISDKITDNYSQINFTYRTLIAAQQKGDKLYIAVPIGAATENNRVFVYDTRKQVWFIEDGNFKYMTNIRQVLYGQNSTGRIYNMVSTSTNDASTEISWQFETKAFSNGVGYPQTVPAMDLMYKASTTLTVGFTTGAESTTYNTIAAAGEFTYGSTDRSKRINIPSTDLQNVPFYKLKFAGTGPASIRRLRRMERTKAGGR